MHFLMLWLLKQKNDKWKNTQRNKVLGGEKELILFIPHFIPVAKVNEF